ncbi:hypothetical protein [Aedoeadaptatus coxii]|uniref:hypothetical protein n=1 Tax=Aedoeadaptatus coxii TaxID=755172 RepID=UPI002AD2D646|nr:hypothetical protein [Peptoniphilus coxii]
MNQEQFEELIKTIGALNEVNWYTIILTILGSLISAFVAFKVAKYQVDKSKQQQQEQMDENRRLEKEMYFRKSKYENTHELIQLCVRIASFYYNQRHRLLDLYGGKMIEEEIEACIEEYRRGHIQPTFPLNIGIIEGGFTEEESTEFKGFDINDKYESVVSRLWICNVQLERLFTSWDNSYVKDEQGYEKCIEVREDLIELYNGTLLLHETLSELNRINLDRLTDKDVSEHWVDEALVAINERYNTWKIYEESDEK